MTTSRAQQLFPAGDPVRPRLVDMRRNGEAPSHRPAHVRDAKQLVRVQLTTLTLGKIDDHSRAVMAARFGFAEDTIRLAAALRPALASRGIPAHAYVDYAEVDVKPENLNPACSGRALWQVPRLNAAG